MEKCEESVIRNLKILLTYLAAQCERPEEQLQELLRAVISELYFEYSEHSECHNKAQEKLLVQTTQRPTLTLVR